MENFEELDAPEWKSFEQKDLPEWHRNEFGPISKMENRDLKNLVKLIKSCWISEISGFLFCPKCGGKVQVDWFELNAECMGCDNLY